MQNIRLHRELAKFSEQTFPFSCTLEIIHEDGGDVVLGGTLDSEELIITFSEYPFSLPELSIGSVSYGVKEWCAACDFASLFYSIYIDRRT